MHKVASITSLLEFWIKNLEPQWQNGKSFSPKSALINNGKYLNLCLLTQNLVVHHNKYNSTKMTISPLHRRLIAASQHSKPEPHTNPSQDTSISGALYSGTGSPMSSSDRHGGEGYVFEGLYQHAIDTRTTKTRYETQEKLRTLLQN